MSAFVIVETPNKHYSTLLKTRMHILLTTDFYLCTHLEAQTKYFRFHKETLRL